MKWLHSLSVVLVISLMLTACGGGGDGGGIPPPSTGVFIDSPVQGLAYSSAPSGLSGLTGPNGEFLYRAGDLVTFSIGGRQIGATTGQPQITPFTLLGRTAVPSVVDAGPVNVAQLLLALDSVFGPETLTVPATLPIFPDPTNFFYPEFDNEMQTAGIPIASEADAIAHLQKQFAIWGSWATAITPSELQVITFMSDGAFILAHDDTPPVAGRVDGMERGTYRWNATTNELTYTVAVDTDGTGGLSHLSASQTPPYTFVIDPSGNSAVFHFGPNVSDQIVFTRVIDANVLIVGAWKLEAPIANFSAVLTMFSDGTFTVASDPILTEPAGMERGTYVYDAATETLTFTTTVDTNGAFGVNESLTLPAVGVVQAIVEPAPGQFDFLRVTETPNTFVRFDRVRVP
ncbi:MAG TPA: hypothetical protein VLL94_14260 [Nitrospiraceae bacterium]|nr:hypothetical protein [Nitrospiraceae bacterium]